MKLFCCECACKVEPRLTDGTEVYPHRPDLYQLPFWKCDKCGNHVGCHHKTTNRTAPLGAIPNAEMRAARQHIHAILDPLWQSGGMKRTHVYRLVSEQFGRKFHTAKLRTIEEARQVYRIVRDITSTEVNR